MYSFKFSSFFPLLKEAKARAKYSNQSTFAPQKRFFQFKPIPRLLSCNLNAVDG